MLIKPIFPFKKFAVLLISVLASGLFAEKSFAQSEQDKPVEILKPLDKPILEENISNQHSLSTEQSDIKIKADSKTTPIAIPSTPIRREVVIGPEGKKSESPSTLSFNIFLYVLEKFKAD